jgi:hypothetical protein
LILRPNSDTGTFPELPRLSEPNAHLSDEINHNLVQSEIEGGVHLHRVAPGTVLEVETQNRVYRIVSQSSSEALISGHPVFCPEPARARIHGSTWGGSMLKEHFIGRGMHLEFRVAEMPPVTTSRILEIRAY